MATTVSAKGWVVIPKALREKYGLTPGRKVTVLDYGGAVTIVPLADDPIAAVSGMFAEPGGRAWTEMLLADHRRERETDERRLGS